MEFREERLIQEHVAHDEELRAAYDEHLELKQRLDALRRKLYLTAEEEIEQKRIQKLKLASKDRLMQILSRYRQSA
jgi:formyltetrahydrofolate synthetase